MGNLLTIGEFSRATMLSVKTLRFYDERGILKPVWVDEATGYRHYSAGQFVEALRIRRLRELDVPLEEIRAFLGAREPDAIAAFLARHRQVLQERLEKGHRDLELLEKLTLEKEAFFLSYKITVREVAPVRALTHRCVVTMENLSEESHRVFTELWTHLERHGSAYGGEGFDIYYGEEFDPNNIDIEYCLSFTNPVPDADGLKVRTVPGGLMACTLHKGPYDQLEGAYTALRHWMEENGYEPVAGSSGARNVYLNSPHEVPPEELCTEVQWPVRKA